MGLSRQASIGEFGDDGVEAAGARASRLALQALLPGFTAADAGRSWAELGLDSFDLLSLRLAVEEKAGVEIPDTDWVEAATPCDLAALAARGAGRNRWLGKTGVSLTETVEIAMPQMALGGLSESWLMKALGDWHWSLVGAALGTRPVDIRDDAGNRLFPTFTRIRFSSNVPLAAFEEGERLEVSASISRYGTTIFFSTVAIVGEEGRAIEAELMSSFSARGADGGNGQLLSAQPALPAGCVAPALPEMPPFGEQYNRRRRSKDSAKPILAKCAYELIPQYDINGVGLVYCAAYPIIADLCQMRTDSDGAMWAAATSTVERDVSYFANAAPDAALEWRLHRDDARDGLATEASIVRGDGVVMALLTSRKASL